MAFREPIWQIPMTDPLYNQIIEGLNKLSDGNKFQSCAADLLRRDYPTLVPISGGNDAGSDGGAVKADGQKIQLICTTQDSVITNVGNSLTESQKKGQTSQSVLIATSQALTAVQKRNLEKKVEEFGKTLLPVVDQEAIANRLYREPRWLKELLGITGTPPALSRVPVNLRPTFDLELAGRDAEKRAVAEADRDLVVVGQPGSGKTSLLVNLAPGIGAAFLVATDSTTIANAIREQQPKRVIVDDAASRLELLTALRQIRQEIGADFKIIATCWPSQQLRVAAQLGVRGEPVVELEPLPQKTIKEIVNAMKIYGPDALVHEILHQAAGKPGLAMTLCQLCLRSGTRELFTGDALTDDVRVSFEAAGTEHAVNILGYFALGGNEGISVEAVAKLTGVPAVKLRDAAETMSAAGVLQDVAEDRLAVEPARLRQALVRDIFFKKAPLDWKAALLHVPSLEATLETIIAAGLLGGSIPDEKFQPLLETIDAKSKKLSDLCGQYARLGAEQARWVLAKFPQLVGKIGSQLLESLPGEALPVLLRTEAAADRRVFGRDDDLKAIRDWIYECAESDESLPRRELLLKTLEAMAAELKGKAVLLAGVRIVMGLGFEWTGATPGDPYRICFSFGLVALPVMERIAEFWPRVFPLLRDFQPPAAFELSKLVNDWTNPRMRAKSPHPEFEAACRVHGRRMLADLLSVYRSQWTVHNRFATVAEFLGQPLQRDTSTLAGKLFPPRQLDPKGYDLNAEAVVLAREWDERGPQPEFVREWVRTDAEAHAANVGSSLSRYVAHALAENTSVAEQWFNALVQAEATIDLVAPFATRCSRESEAFRREFIGKNLKHPAYAQLAVTQLVQSILPEDGLWAGVDPILAEHVEQIKWMVMRDTLPASTLEALLTKHGAQVAGSVAAELWRRVEQGTLAESLHPAWESAVVESMEGDHELAEISIVRPDLAFAWLKRRVNRTAEEEHALNDLSSYRLEGAMTSALSPEQRRELIDSFGPENHHSELLRGLIGGDLELYRHALRRPETRDLVGGHLGPPGNPVEPWAERAKLLLDAGYTEDHVMWASDVIGGSWTGPISNHHEAKRVCFARLLDYPDPRVRRIGEAAVEFLTARRDNERKVERRAAVRGEIV